MCDDITDNNPESMADVLDEIETILESNNLMGYIQIVNKEHGMCSGVFPKWSGLKGNNLSIELDLDMQDNSIDYERFEYTLEALYNLASMSISGSRMVRKLINEIHARLDKIEE